MMKHNLVDRISHQIIMQSDFAASAPILNSGIYDSGNDSSTTFLFLANLGNNATATGWTINKIYQSDSINMADKIEVPSNKIIGVFPLVILGPPSPPVLGNYPTLGLIDTKRYLYVESSFEASPGITNQLYAVAMSEKYVQPVNGARYV